MYIFLNRGLGMSPGKLASQAAHAAIECYLVSRPSMRFKWREGGHCKKLVMMADDETHLLLIEHYLKDRGFQTKLVIDEGLTEVRPHSATALGVEIVNKDDSHSATTFSSFKLYREKPQPCVIDPFSRKKKWWDFG